MSAASILDSMVSVTSLNHGGASKALSQVGDNHPVVVLKNNQPSAVIITPADYDNARILAHFRIPALT